MNQKPPVRFYPRVIAGAFLLAAAWLLPAAVGAAESPAASAADPVATAPPGSPYSHLRKTKVPGIEEELWCGTLRVFENRQTRSGRTIDLKVVVLPALDQAGKQEPLFDLAGGPGIAATGGAAFYATAGKEYRRHRDVVLVDQRGTGESNPLAAPPDPRPQRFVGEIYPVEYVKNLRRMLEERADLTQYTTPIAMDDLDGVRAWLGYERINLFGLSYGTRAVMDYIRQHPGHVSCAILMGVVPTFMKIPLYHSRDGERAMNLLLEECAGDPAGSKAFPGLRREWMDLLARLEKRPAHARYVSLDKKTEVTVEIGRDVFAENIRDLLYDAATARKIPLIIHEAAHGNFDPFLAVAIPADRSAPDLIADGMYLSVTTAEDMAFIDLGEARKMNSGTMFGNYRVEQQMRAARLWPRGKLPEGYDQPVSTDLPVLILSGFMDPVTPPEWAEQVARHMPKSRLVVIPHGANLPFSLSHQEIPDKLMLEFLAAGNAKDLDVRGVDQMLPPPFVTKVTK